ncbi:hypothetical protein [Acinetobacter larvae]|uniref:Uncharacterized protein n=1 Tax=Acinetobacter larvae TaxID=1789224 RepID=A0A1B2LXB1_9GAMM|nr:hypothetical protein [Acinetobacter larvae]AOA57584.1 hypothetical protein BFG52_03920 [Acinetobacter larvae]
MIDVFLAKFYKYVIAVLLAVLLVLFIGSLIQRIQINSLKTDLAKAEQSKTDAVAKAVKPYEQAIAKARSEAMTKEKTYQDNLLKAEQNAIEKIKTANNDASRADAAASSLSKQLAEAKRNLSNAPRETIVEYIEVSSDIFEQCVSEYRAMAKAADAERIDKEKLIEAWPSN